MNVTRCDRCKKIEDKAAGNVTFRMAASYQQDWYNQVRDFEFDLCWACAKDLYNSWRPAPPEIHNIAVSK
jgi:hypothetical protein